MCVTLEAATVGADRPLQSKGVLAGTIVSSLYRLRDVDNTEAGFFVFGDTSVRGEGSFRLKFCLFEITTSTSSCSQEIGAILHIKSVVSDVFTSFACKNFPGVQQTTFLSRTFSDQGVRLRIRKETRLQNDKNHSSQQHEQTKDDGLYTTKHVLDMSATGAEPRGMHHTHALALSVNDELSRLQVAQRPFGYVATRFCPYSFPAWSEPETAGCFLDYTTRNQAQFSDHVEVLSTPNSIVEDRSHGSVQAISMNSGRYPRHNEGWQDRVLTAEQDFLEIQHFANNGFQDLPVHIRGCSTYASSPTSMLASSQTIPVSRDHRSNDGLLGLEHNLPMKDDLTLPPILFEKV